MVLRYLFVIASLLSFHVHTQQVIQPTYYTQASAFTSPKKLFWLQVPGEKQSVLIQLKSSEANLPRINAATGDSNFSYVNPGKGGGDKELYTLPAGLYHWQGTARDEARNKPNDPAWKFVFNHTTKKAEYRSSDQRVWDATRHAQHPFDATYMQKITTPAPTSPSHGAGAGAGALARGTAASAAAASTHEDIHTITVASFNVLAEKNYTNVARGLGTTSPRMAFDDRKKLLGEVVRTIDADVFLWQELFAQEVFTIKKHKNFDPAFIFGSELLRTADTPDTVVIYNALHLNPVAQSYISFKQATDRDSFGATVAVLETRDSKKTRFIAASVHLQGGVGTINDYEQHRINQLKILEQEVAQLMKTYTTNRVIIGGDFNINAKNPGLLTLLQKALPSFTDAQKQPANSRPATNLAVSKDKKAHEESMDYIFYTPSTLRLMGDVRYMPANTDALISHGLYDDRQRTWPSDHKVLIATFSFSKKSGARAGAGAV